MRDPNTYIDIVLIEGGDERRGETRGLCELLMKVLCKVVWAQCTSEYNHIIAARSEIFFFKDFDSLILPSSYCIFFKKQKNQEVKWS